MRRNITLPPFTTFAAIGVTVVDTSRLLATNTARGPSGIPNMTFQPGFSDGAHTYTITDPNTVPYGVGDEITLTDDGFVNNNTETVIIELEETE